MAEDEIHPDPAVAQMQRIVGSRHVAADILSRVAEWGQAGSWPREVTCEEVGRALFRIAMNAPEKDPLFVILHGWRAAELEYRKELDDLRCEATEELIELRRRLGNRP